MRGALLAAAALCARCPAARGHGAVTSPPPRNAVDSDRPPWSGGVPDPVPFQPWCAFASAAMAGKDPRNLTGANGQACFWFSNGCGIGCAACDGSTRGPIPRFDADMRPDVNYTDAALCRKMGKPDGCFPDAKQPVCAAPGKATNCDPATRTVNTGAECGAADDFYYYSPWRAPGSAPVLDACGSAGGRIAGQGHGNFGAAYVRTAHSQAGDAGSRLPPAPSGATWAAGAVVEVAWGLAANHGGGYSYRLCKASRPLTEGCFQETPLRFVGEQSMRWGGAGGYRIFYNGTYVSEGTVPAGSMWSMNPIPRGVGRDTLQTGRSFPPRCTEAPGRKCSGGAETGLENLEIVDRVAIPAGLEPGEWVLGWRWDCEESNQIWASCSDVTIT